MNSKVKNFLAIIITLFIGIIGTLLTQNYIDKEKKTEPVSKNVTIKEENTIKSAIDKVYNSVVLIKAYKGVKQISSGTGFVYKKDNKYGYIMTNHHVIEGADKVTIVNIDGTTAEASLKGSDDLADIAVLTIDEKAVLKVAELGDSSNSKLGDTIFTVGSPLGENYMGTVTKGILSGKDRTISVDTNSGGWIMEVLQTDAAINPGNSGGPLVNINGEVIGVNSLKLVEDEIEGMGFAIPMELALTTVSRIENGEELVRPLVGIEMLEINSVYGLYQNNITIDKSVTHGVVVVKVNDGSPAAKSGIQKGDVITFIDGNKIDSVAKFRYTLYKYSVGDKMKVKIMRGSTEKELQIELNEAAE
jgi:Trypsin-like serine proteases, typically periplasmic, contain C-terminal PDZ domain